MNTLSLREAASKYGIPATTLSGWVKAGLIRVVQGQPQRGKPMLVFERDVAELAAEYTPGRSRWKRPTLAS